MRRETRGRSSPPHRAVRQSQPGRTAIWPLKSIVRRPDGSDFPCLPEALPPEPLTHFLSTAPVLSQAVQPEAVPNSYAGSARDLTAADCRASSAPQKSIRASRRLVKATGSPFRVSQLGVSSAVGQPPAKDQRPRHSLRPVTGRRSNPSNEVRNIGARGRRGLGVPVVAAPWTRSSVVPQLGVGLRRPGRLVFPSILSPPHRPHPKAGAVRRGKNAAPGPQDQLDQKRRASNGSFLRSMW